MLEPSEFHLELAFVTARALSKDIKDQRIAIEHAQSRQLLKVALLTRRERVIDQNDFGAGIDRNLTNFIGLATTDKIFGIRTIALTRDGRCHRNASRLGELRKLVEIFLLDRRAET